MSVTLRADVCVARGLPVAIIRDGSTSTWSPISCTLIHGKHEAVLVDTPISISQTEALIAWIEEKRWPNLRAVATADTVAHMKRQLEPAWWDNFWMKFFPGNQIAEPVVIAEPLQSNIISLEGHELQVVEMGHSDTRDTTVLWVQDLKLVVAGDVVYGDVHQYFAEANTAEKRAEWIRAIEKIEALNPKTVVAGHKRPGSVDGYIRTFEELIKVSKSPTELSRKMREAYPDRVNPHAILSGAAAAFK
ncbi:beta-lactamase-like protein [Xylogone sp. PMI_703]|nr:beta-lactamase-like protein [Xylogone sp. PMI_703]